MGTCCSELPDLPDIGCSQIETIKEKFEIDDKGFLMGRFKDYKGEINLHLSSSAFAEICKHLKLKRKRYFRRGNLLYLNRGAE